jgi:hypothetical protein
LLRVRRRDEAGVLEFELKPLATLTLDRADLADELSDPFGLKNHS